MQRDDTKGMRRRLILCFIGMLTTLLGGALGYYLLGEGRWNFNDCLYMTAISLSTVGYGEIIDVGAVPGARVYTMAIILFGMGVIVYFASTVVAFIVEGEIKQYFWRKKMDKQIGKLKHHVIICGAGATGAAVVREMTATRTPFVVVDASEERIRHILDEEKNDEVPFLVGDASADHVLVEAGIHHARGLVATLPEDKDNLFVVISARQLNPDLRIVSRGVEPTVADKLRRVGADSVVFPNLIGGMRLASEMLRPSVVQFLDLMLRDKEKNLRVEEITLPATSPFIGKTLRQADFRSHCDVLVVAAKGASGEYRHNPRPDFVLEANTVLIVIAQVEEVERLRHLCRAAE